MPTNRPIQTLNADKAYWFITHRHHHYSSNCNNRAMVIRFPIHLMLVAAMVTITDMHMRNNSKHHHRHHNNNNNNNSAVHQ